MFPRLPLATILRLQTGDEAAFDETYAHYRDLLFLIIFGISKHRETSEDLLQDVFIKVFTEAKTLKNPMMFHSWIVKIAQHAALNAIRRPAEQTVDEAEWNERGQEDQPSDFIATWHSFLSREANLIVAYRIVYELTFLEISGLTGTSPSDAYRTYRDALTKLKAWYREHEGAAS